MKKITLLFTFLTVMFSYQGYAQYCAAGPTSGADSNVQQVDITGDAASAISHTGCPGVIGAEDLTAQSIDVTAGSSYTLSVTFGTCGSNYAGAGEVWIDFDQSLSFETGESVGSSSGTPGTAPWDVAVDFTVNIPAGATNGATVMRIMQQEGGSLPLDACGTYSWGSVMDFTVNVSGGVDPPACTNPGGLTATPTSLTDVTVDWTAGGTETDWTYEYGATGFTQGTGTTGTATGTPTASITGLTSSSIYDVYVQANCGGTEGDSNFIGPVSWTQPSLGESCTAPIVATVESDCSTATPVTIDFTTAVDIGSAGTCDTTTGNIGAWLEFTAPASGSILVSNTGSNNEYVIYDSCGGTEIDCGTLAASNEFSGLTPSTVYKVAIWKDSFYTMTVDDFCIEEVTCGAPSALTADTITSSSASLGWTAGGAETAWDIELLDVTLGETATGTPTASGVANPYMAMGLTSANDYEFYVRADCGASGVSDWAGPFSFTTACDTFAPPYTGDFTTVAPTCWSEGNNTDVATGPNVTNGGWANDDYLNVVGIEAAKFNLFDTGDQDWLVSPTFDFSTGGFAFGFDVGVTAWNSTDAETPNLMGSDDEVQVLYSEDDGATWTNLETFNVANAPSHLGESRVYDLSATTSATVKFAFWANEGTVDDAEDVDFFVANFAVDSYAALGVDEVSQFNNFKYFPNPVEGTLSLRAQENMQNVAVYNMLGQEVINTFPNAMSNELDMSALSRGTYFVRISIDGAVENFKIIKE